MSRRPKALGPVGAFQSVVPPNQFTSDQWGFAGQDRAQQRFPSAIGPHNGPALAGFDKPPSAGEHNPSRLSNGEIVAVQQHASGLACMVLNQGNAHLLPIQHRRAGPAQVFFELPLATAAGLPGDNQIEAGHKGNQLAA